MKEKLRVDKYLWAIRIFKTRTQATNACDDGKVKCNGTNVKASKTVSIGEHYDIRTTERTWSIEVRALLYQRVSHEKAIESYIDLTPVEERQEPKQYQNTSFYTGKRLSKTGHPSKKQRRDLEGFFNDKSMK